MLRGERVHQKIWEHRRQRSPGRSPGAPGLNCLVLGGGGREYAIAWRLANCASVTTIDITPGNAGMSLFTRLVDFRPDDVGRLEEHIVASHIDLAVVGTDELIAAGIGDVLRRSGIAVVGASREALGSPPISGGPVLLEELLEGDEASLQALVDGETVVALPPARDHKRVGDGDTGPNTGGMGAFSPTAVLPDHEAQPVADALIAPIARTLRKRGVDYRGVLYAGLIRTDRGWRVLEYNARFGDPEAEVTLPRIEGDFARLLVALGEGKLAAYVAENPVRFSDRAFVDVVLCAENYPGTPKTGMRIDGLDRLPEGVFSFHGATRRDPTGGTVVSGGRAIHIVGTGANLSEARDRAYLGAERVSFEGKFYRSDIARQEVAVA